MCISLTHETAKHKWTRLINIKLSFGWQLRVSYGVHIVGSRPHCHYGKRCPHHWLGEQLMWWRHLSPHIDFVSDSN